MVDIDDDSGEGLDIRPLVSGTDTISVFPSGNFVVQDKNYSNKLIYTGGNIGSIYRYFGTGSEVKVFSYSGAVLIDVTSWVTV